MISSVDVKDQKMPALLIGGLQPEEEQVDLPLDEGRAPHLDVADLREEEAGLLGEETEVVGADHAWEGGLDHEVVADEEAEAK